MKKSSLIFLILGIVCTVGLAKFGKAPVQEHARVVAGNDLSASTGRVIVRGVVQDLKRADTCGVTLYITCTDGTPVTAYAGPDVPSAGYVQRTYPVALTGRVQGGLFLVSDCKQEEQLSEMDNARIVARHNDWFNGDELWLKYEGRLFSVRARNIPQDREWVKIAYLGRKIVVE